MLLSPPETSAANAVATITRINQTIATVRRVEDAKKLCDMAEALRVCAKKSGKHFDVQQKAAEAKLRVERRGGELLAAWPKNPGGKSTACRLQEVGIEHTQSHRWQRIASLPENLFENFLKTTIESGQELTTAAVLCLAKRTRNAVRNGEVVAQATSTSDLETLRTSGEKFGTIYADPPWQYGNQATRAATDNHYDTMTVEAIAALPIAELAADDAHLHLWVTNGFLFESKAILDAWGFEFRSTFIWCKNQMGIGNYWRNSHEILLTAIRGDAKKFNDRSLKSWEAIDRGEHSAKPEKVRKFIERASPAPRLELFGRRLADGWTVWGNEIVRTMFDVEVA